MKKILALASLLVLVVVVWGVQSVVANGDEELGTPSIVIASGSGVVAAGTGLLFSQPGTINLNVPGTGVNQVLLYWSGVGLDDTIDIDNDGEIATDSDSVVGELIGEVPAGYVEISSTYRADITSLGLIGNGANALTVGGLTTGADIENDGAGLLVIYDDGTTTTIDLRDGHDHAYYKAEPELQRTTTPVEFNFAPAGESRTANLSMFFGNVAGTKRPNAVDITVSDGVTDTVTELINPLHADDGQQWDTLIVSVNIPADANMLTVQAFSEDRLPMEKPSASFNWINVAMTLDEPVDDAFARITGGFRATGTNGESVRSTGGMTLHCDVELSNNLQVGWNGGQKWHINKLVDAAFCWDDDNFTPDPPDAPANTFIGIDIGKLNNVDDSFACFVFTDHGETATDEDGEDTLLIRIWNVGYDPGITEADLVEGFDCSSPNGDSAANLAVSVGFAEIEGGNLQFHFDQPHKNK